MTTLFLDPRIRDYVFIPLIFLMFSLQLVRIHAFRYMNEPKNFLTEKAKVSYATLRHTMLEDDADMEAEPPEEQIDVNKKLDEIPNEHKEKQALARSNRVRKSGEWLPENAVKTRKAFYSNATTGYLNKEPGTASQQNLITNPDMMNTMLK